MSSLRKESTVSSLDSPPSVQQMTITEAPRKPDLHLYPVSSPNRPVYLALRMLVIVSGLAQIILSVAADRGVPRRRWMSPVLSPAITSAIASAVDTFFVLSANRRCHPLQRLLYEGAIGIGYAIASGFMVSWTLPDLTRTEPSSTPTTQGIGAGLLFLMFSSMILQWCIAYSGGKQLLQVRRERRAGLAQV